MDNSNHEWGCISLILKNRWSSSNRNRNWRVILPTSPKTKMDISKIWFGRGDTGFKYGHVFGFYIKSLGCRPIHPASSAKVTLMSLINRRSTLGRCTFTATSRPVRSRARWTWQMARLVEGVDLAVNWQNARKAWKSNQVENSRCSEKTHQLELETPKNPAIQLPNKNGTRSFPTTHFYNGCVTSSTISPFLK